MSSNSSSISSCSWAGSSIVISTPTSVGRARPHGRLAPARARRGAAAGAGAGAGGAAARGNGRGERVGLGVERRGLVGVPLEPVDLGHHAQALSRRLVLALLAVEVDELLQGLEVVREAPQHRLELVLGLVAEAVLAEDAALRRGAPR